MPFCEKVFTAMMIVKNRTEIYSKIKKIENWLRSTIYQIYPDINILVTNRSAMSPISLKFFSLEQCRTVNQQVQDKGQIEGRMFYVYSVYFNQNLL